MDDQRNPAGRIRPGRRQGIGGNRPRDNQCIRDMALQFRVADQHIVADPAREIPKCLLLALVEDPGALPPPPGTLFIHIVICRRRFEDGSLTDFRTAEVKEHGFSHRLEQKKIQPGRIAEVATEKQRAGMKMAGAAPGDERIGQIGPQRPETVGLLGNDHVRAIAERVGSGQGQRDGLPPPVPERLRQHPGLAGRRCG